MNYFYYKDNQPTGPVHENEIKQMMNSGQLTEDDLVCQEGMNEWKPVGYFIAGVTSSDNPVLGGGDNPIVGTGQNLADAPAQVVPTPSATNTNLEREYELYLAYSEEIDQLTDLLGEVDERQAKDVHTQIAQKLMICRKHIDRVKPSFPHALEVKSMEADYLFNSAIKLCWEHGFSHRVAANQLEIGSQSKSLTRLGLAGVSRMVANSREKANGNKAIGLLQQSIGFLDAPSTRLAKANVHNQLGQKQAALDELNFVIMNFQDDPAYIPARRLKD